MTAAPLDRKAWASQLEPPATERKSSPDARYTSIYLLPMWCLCLFSAMSLCSWLTNRTSASPFRLPCAERQRATPPLQKKWTCLIHSLPQKCRPYGNNFYFCFQGRSDWIDGSCLCSNKRKRDDFLGKNEKNVWQGNKWQYYQKHTWKYRVFGNWTAKIKCHM